MNATTAKQLDANWSPFLRHQWQLFAREPDELPGPFIAAMLGWWGSAKTTAAARRFVRVLLANPWTSAYGETGRPQAVVMAPTRRILLKATMPALEKLIPRDLIIDRRKSPDHWWLLANGVEVSFVSGEQGFEGESLVALWIDEVSKFGFEYDPDKFKNYLSRLRDPLSPHLEMVVSGLAEAGWVRDTFDTETMEPAQRHNRYTRLCGTNDNPHLPKDLLRQILATTPSDEAKIVKEGGWATITGGVFSNFDASIHLVDMAGDPNKPVSLGLDAGNQGAVVMVQAIRVQCKDEQGKPRTEDGLLFVDQMLPHNEALTDICRRIKTETHWKLTPGLSTISVDPRLRVDELNAIRAAFPGVQLIQREPHEPAYRIDYGIRLMKAQLRDGLGNVHILFNRKLASQRSGIIEAIQVAKKDPITGVVSKDERTDHIRDAARYAICSYFKKSVPIGLAT